MFRIFNNMPNSMLALLNSLRPTAMAEVRGGIDYPDLYGTAKFYQLQDGVAIICEFYNLPENGSGFFGMHIHEGGDCDGDFTSAGEHFNPTGEEHPCHAGDLPPILSANGYAFAGTFTDRFRVEDVIGRTLLIHANADDFNTQPAGDSGTRIACGSIK